MKLHVNKFDINKPISEREGLKLRTGLVLITLLMQEEISLSEIMQATGFTFQEARLSIQNLLDSRLVKLIASDPLPIISVLDFDACYHFLELHGYISSPEQGFINDSIPSVQH
jgi:hypothetical protein